MLVLNPQTVVFGSVALEKVSVVTLERVGTRVVVEWGDGGPHVKFADVPEQRVNVRVVQEIDSATVDMPKPGDSAILSFVASMSGADAGRKKWNGTAVVTGVSYEIGQATGRSVAPRAARTISFVLVSGDGAEDPVGVVEV